MTIRLSRPRFGAAAVALALGTSAVLLGPAIAARQQPTFRANVDVIDLDVRVVTDNGTPVVGLGPDKFEVSIDGKRRQVVSADLIRYGQDAPAKPQAPTAAAVWLAPTQLRLNVSDSRIYVLVIDVSTYDHASAAGTTAAARAFVGQLTSDDMVGLFVFPTGPQISPTTDRGKVMTALQQISGDPQTPILTRDRDLNLRPTETMDLSEIFFRPDGAPAAPFTSRTDQLILILCPTPQGMTIAQVLANEVQREAYLTCTRQLKADVKTIVEDHERQAQHSLSLLRSLVTNLADVPGRKNLILLNGGLFTSNRPGKRPDIGNLDRLIGEEAVKTNTSIYTIFNDWRSSQRFSASQRRSPNTMDGIAADNELFTHTLATLTGAAGGAFFKALTGSGQTFFDQIVRETSAYYILGVVPDEKDRDGRPHELAVKVRQSGVTVRGGRWVTVPKR